MKLILTESQRAAILAGGTELDLGATANTGAGELSEAQVQAAAAAETARLAAEAAAATTAAAAAAEPAKPAPQTGDVVAFLTGQISAKDSQLLEANVKIASLTAAAADSSACLPDLLKIAQGVVGQMQIALSAGNTADALSAKDIIAEHARVSQLYLAKFPTGRITAVAGDPAATGTADNVLSIELGRRLAAAQQ